MIVAYNNGKYYGFARMDKSIGIWEWTDRSDDITHWMPIPKNTKCRIVMERKIGEEFNFLGYTLKTEKSESGNCDECFFYQHELDCLHKEIRDIIGNCWERARQDNKEAIFTEEV